jgi:anaerobic glycerol-3-phosphate dehydrogenase
MASRKLVSRKLASRELASRKLTSRKRVMIPIVACALVLATGGAFGQGSEQERAACRQDVRRFCQAELQRNPDDALSVTACLQANRSKISSSCRNTLTRHHQ